MALHRLLGMEIGVPDPATLDDFYQEIGLTGSGGQWGPDDQPGQIQLVEAPYRQLRRMRVACEGEADIDRAARNLDELGIKYETGDGQLRCTDPINAWEVVLEPTVVSDVSTQPVRVVNRPGDRPRTGARAEIILEEKPRPPRRLGHIVTGTPDPVGTLPIYEALGFRVSDTVLGMVFFLRCSPDHHNFLITPGEVPYLNHYALEHDDFDAVAKAASIYLREHGEDKHIAGPGRHQIGGNQFWYLQDPSGTFFEFFADMDRIEDDEAWEIGTDWDPVNSWSVWGEAQQPEVFFRPTDMDAIAAGWKDRQG